MTLSVRQHMLLQHADPQRQAGDWYRREGTLRHVFGCSPTQVHAELLALIETQDAEAEYPALVHRLRRLKAQRRAVRSVRARNA